MSTLATRIRQLMVSYFSLSDYIIPQAEAEAAIRDGISFRGTNIIILIVAIFIASLGLNTNSTAVIIGAMLISPLMGPIIGIGLGVGIQDYNLLKQCLRNLFMAAVFSVIASTIYFLISPVSESHSELLARTSPTIYDVLIGFFGGAAGIIGIASRSKGNVIPGVAIATALMPPLCTVGYGIATWQPVYFLGAAYLFLINSVYIALATFIGVKLMNFRSSPLADNARALKVRRLIYVIAVIVMLPSIYMTWRMITQANFSSRASAFVAGECRFPDTQVLSHTATEVDGVRTIEITLIGRPLPVDSLELALSSKLHFYGLRGVKLDIFQGNGIAASTAATGALAEATRDDNIYMIAQSTITRQQTTIDSLRSVLALQASADTVAGALSPELKVIFPSVDEIAVTRAIFGSVDGSGRLDTLNVALVKYTSPMPASQRDKFHKYLLARLGLPKITIVTMQ